jgi:MinD superfamily P-loop ATPase
MAQLSGLLSRTPDFSILQSDLFVAQTEPTKFALHSLQFALVEMTL